MIVTELQTAKTVRYGIKKPVQELWPLRGEGVYSREGIHEPVQYIHTSLSAYTYTFVYNTSTHDYVQYGYAHARMLTNTDTHRYVSNPRELIV